MTKKTPKLPANYGEYIHRATGRTTLGFSKNFKTTIILDGVVVDSNGWVENRTKYLAGYVICFKLGDSECIVTKPVSDPTENDIRTFKTRKGATDYANKHRSGLHSWIRPYRYETHIPLHAAGLRKIADLSAEELEYTHINKPLS